MISGRCAACRYLRRRCPSDCIFSLYFPANNPQRFSTVHRIYGASNVAKMLQQIPPSLRAEAAETLYFEARCRLQDPIYGCSRLITELQRQIQEAESQLAKTLADISVFSSTTSQQMADPTAQDFVSAHQSGLFGCQPQLTFPTQAWFQ